MYACFQVGCVRVQGIDLQDGQDCVCTKAHRHIWGQGPVRIAATLTACEIQDNEYEEIKTLNNWNICLLIHLIAISIYMKGWKTKPMVIFVKSCTTSCKMGPKLCPLTTSNNPTSLVVNQINQSFKDLRKDLRKSEISTWFLSSRICGIAKYVHLSRMSYICTRSEILLYCQDGVSVGLC